MEEYVSCCKQRDVPVDKSHRNNKESCCLLVSISRRIYFCHERTRTSSKKLIDHLRIRIYFCHERTTMTSETSENTIFVRFYFTLCYLMLTLRNIPNCDRGDYKYLTAVSCDGEDFRENIDICWLLIRHPTDKEPISFMVCKKQTSHSRIFFFRIFPVKFWKL